MVDESVLRCSFCNRTQHEVEQLVAGPAVFMCNRCLVLAAEALTSAPFRRSAAPACSDQKAYCTFCGKGTNEVALARTPQAVICAECTLKGLEFMLNAVRPEAEPREM
jgi:hypothetical protein